MPEPSVASEAEVDTSGDIDLRLPAETGQLPVLRAVAATVAANGGFDVDEIADIRMLVDELSSMLVGVTASGTELRCRLRTVGRELTVHTCAVTVNELQLPTDGLHRRILDTLADSVWTWTTSEGPSTTTHLVASTSTAHQPPA